MLENRKRPLIFENFPDLEANIPWVKLAPLRTPIVRLNRLQERLGFDSLWIKQDNLTSPLYGGNKVRKLEFLLAMALKKGCTKVMTVGGIGSNHCVANAVFCNELKLKPISALFDQPVTTYVRNNLLLELYLKAKIIYSHGVKGIKRNILWNHIKNRNLYFIGPGGSTPLGILGFVNAAFELRDQVNNGAMPKPDYIFVACGSAGTVAGLTIGVKLARLNTVIYGVRVTPSFLSDFNVVVNLATKSMNLMVKNDKSIPKITFKHLKLDEGYFGDIYGKPTPECLEAIKILKDVENIKLEPTYTGKTMAALIGNTRTNKQELKDKTILFWNTYSSRDFSEILKKIDYHDLPKKLHWVFEEPMPDFGIENY